MSSWIVCCARQIWDSRTENPEATNTLAIGESRGSARDTFLLRPKISSFSCSFLGKIGQIIGWRPLCIGKSKGAPWRPPLGPNSFIFMQFSGIFWPNNRLAPPSLENPESATACPPPSLTNGRGLMASDSNSQISWDSGSNRITQIWQSLEERSANFSYPPWLEETPRLSDKNRACRSKLSLRVI